MSLQKTQSQSLSASLSKKFFLKNPRPVRLSINIYKNSFSLGPRSPLITFSFHLLSLILPASTIDFKLTSLFKHVKPAHSFTTEHDTLYQERAVFGKMKIDPAKQAQTQNAGEVSSLQWFISQFVELMTDKVWLHCIRPMLLK